MFYGEQASEEFELGNGGLSSSATYCATGDEYFAESHVSVAKSNPKADTVVWANAILNNKAAKINDVRANSLSIL